MQQKSKKNTANCVNFAKTTNFHEFSLKPRRYIVLLVTNAQRSGKLAKRKNQRGGIVLNPPTRSVNIYSL